MNIYYENSAFLFNSFHVMRPSDSIPMLNGLDLEWIIGLELFVPFSNTIQHWFGVTGSRELNLKKKATAYKNP